MKNTVKKILALVFVVAMVCSLAVPVFAANVAAKVVFISADKDGAVASTSVSVDAAKTTVLAALKAADSKTDFKVGTATIDFSYRNNKLSDVRINNAATADVVVPGTFETAKWVVALNGKIVDEDLSTVSFKKNDVITVFLYEGSFNTKFAQYDASNIEAGIISFYYYDAEGNKQPLVGAKVTVTGVLDLLNPAAGTETSALVTYTGANGQIVTGTDGNAVWTGVTYAANETDGNGLPMANKYTNVFTTDEKGQIWIAPQYLDSASITIASVTMSTSIADQDDTDYDDDEYDYYEANAWRHFEGRQLADSVVKTSAMYTTAGATGDMTVVYVMVAAAAVITLGAVVIMKKKAVKAN